MSDLLRRYLEQQIEMGGAEVVLSGAPAAATPPAPAETAGDPGARWRKDAPAIPGPGLAVDPPAFLVDELARAETLDAVATLVAACTRCPLHLTRTNPVPGEGNPKAQLMLVGEGPGETEDRLGRPFVGRAGELLNGILAAIGLPREEVYIANIVKSRPPQNRKPLPDEVSACIPYLYRQIALIKPKVILAMGGTAGESLLGVKQSLTQLRGKVHRFAGIPLVVTYHPAALLRNPNWKKPTWDDVRIARQLLDG
ncbi:MAG TPA: uracil-DNA glycosylase [Gemmatimonadales bacterium]|nr:uracil-DNA glycosylase [Gemmatimonadales bacterium]